MVMAAPEQAQTPMVAEASVQPLSVDMPLSPGGLCNHGQFLHALAAPGRTRINHKIQKRIAIKQDRSDTKIAPRRRWPAALVRVAYHYSPQHLYFNSGQVKHLPQACA